MWPSGLTLAITLTLHFQGQIRKFLYLNQKWSNCHKMKGKLYQLNSRPQMWPLGLPWQWPKLILNFQGQIWNLLYLNHKWSGAGILLIGPLSLFSLKFKYFYWRKCICKCRLRNVFHYISASMCYSKMNMDGMQWRAVAMQGASTSHGTCACIEYAGWMGRTPCLPWVRISMTSAISMLRNDRK